MICREKQTDAVDNSLRDWRQGDFSLDPGLEFMHLADLSRPHSPASVQLAAEYDGQVQAEENALVSDKVKGFAVLTQTCDIARSCDKRPFVEIAPLVLVNDEIMEQIRRLKRPGFAYIPSAAQESLVADLDRIMTVEKAVLTNWTRVPGCHTDTQIREFAKAIARKRSRFAFPDDFVKAIERLRQRLTNKYYLSTLEGSHLRTLREIRVQAVPSWDHKDVELNFWFIKDHDLDDGDSDWSDLLDLWKDLIDESGRFRVETFEPHFLEDISARDYVESDPLDLDGLSVEREKK